MQVNAVAIQSCIPATTQVVPIAEHIMLKITNVPPPRPSWHNSDPATKILPTAPHTEAALRVGSIGAFPARANAAATMFRHMVPKYAIC